MTIGDNIKKQRIIKKITQSELADIINKSLRMIQKYEANDVTPSLEIIEYIAKALEVSPTIITGWESFNENLINTYLKGIDVWSNNKFLDVEEREVIKMHFADLLIKYKELINKVVDRKFSLEEFEKHYSEYNNTLDIPLNKNQIKELFWKDELDKELQSITNWNKAFPAYLSGVYPNPNDFTIK